MTRPDHNPVQRLDTPLLTPAEAAQLLAVKPSWIYEAVRSGTLPCLRIGRHIRFTRVMLEDWLQGRVAQDQTDCASFNGSRWESPRSAVVRPTPFALDDEADPVAPLMTGNASELSKHQAVWRATTHPATYGLAVDAG